MPPTQTENKLTAIASRLSDQKEVEVQGSKLMLPKPLGSAEELGTVDGNGNYLLRDGQKGNLFGKGDIRVTQVDRRSDLKAVEGQVARDSSIVPRLRNELTETGKGVYIVGIDSDSKHLEGVRMVATGHREYSVAPEATWVNELIEPGNVGMKPTVAGLGAFLDARVGTLDAVSSKLNQIAQTKEQDPTSLAPLRVANISIGNSIQDISREIHTLMTTEPYSSHMGEWKKEIFGSEKMPEGRGAQFPKIQEYIARHLEKSDQFSQTLAAYQAATKRASDAGVVVVVAAGNKAPDVPLGNPGHSLNFAAMSADVVVVAASNTNRTPGNLADDFSRISGEGLTVKGRKHQPTITAPGEYIQVARPVAPGQLGIFVESGSSVAAPAVAGTLALMFQANPKLSVADARAALTAAAVDTPASASIEGAGMLDSVKAVQLATKRK